MAPLRTAQARTRPRRSPPPKPIDVFDDSDRDELSLALEDEPPFKRIRTSRKSSSRSRWIPGGRGGGGRHVGLEDFRKNNPAPRNTDDYIRSRPRVARETKKTMTSTPRYSARSRNRGATRPRYSTAAAASAAVAHGDGYKPREERGWEEFHPDLDLDADFAVILSEEIDGVTKNDMTADGIIGGHIIEQGQRHDDSGSLTPSRKKPGRPPRSRDSMLHALMTPEAPKLIPTPGPNPRERLTLPKPSYRELDPFLSYEHKDIAAVNFVDKSMANVGYQESEMYLRPERTLIRQMEGSAEEDLDLSPDLIVNGENSAIGGSGVGKVEYDMDEQDVKWLEAFNKIRTKDGVAAIKPAIFEITMTKIEKEWHALEKRIPKPNPKAPQTQRPRSSSAAAVNGEPSGEEPDSKCAICDDGDCENANAIVFCDGCDLAVHQECYGVPYIPEGQWLCRKCQLVGNSRPSCIFCPNEGGAFKQTNNSKWAHLFCATWIPEVTIGNPSLMEPITDVEKVPPSRWKLLCYICKQEMGASIQCSDGRCYEPFHLTCARQAGLYLRMKTGGGQNTLMDVSQLRAYCHKHTPIDWRLEHNTDRAFENAIKHFKEHFRGQVWADSRASALAINDTSNAMGNEKGPLKVTLTNRKGPKPKTIWRLPSGAPVIPEVILKSIEDALVRFSVQKKKEYVSEICKYWTLKREARRGAALLKRLQLQMDTFSSFEVTRRDYKSQGAAGRARLDRRIEFAETLTKDLGRIREICDLIKQREAEKLTEAMLLKDVIDTIYVPIPPLLEPIIDKALKHDRGTHRQGLLQIREKLRTRGYNTVGPFAIDILSMLSSPLGLQATGIEDLITQVSGRAEDMTSEQREKRSLARRILKAIQPGLEEAIRKEGELTGRPYAQQIKEMDEALLSRRASFTMSIDRELVQLAQKNHINGIASPMDVDVDIPDAGYVNGVNGVDNTHPDETTVQETMHGMIVTSETSAPVKPGLLQPSSTPPASTNGIKHDQANGDAQASPKGKTLEPPTPPMSLQGQAPGPGPIQIQGPLNQGGIPWYAEPFDPVGTTIFEERWTGPDVLRDMSEELSEMDEDELQGLGPDADDEDFKANGIDDLDSTKDIVDNSTSRKSTSIKKGQPPQSSAAASSSSSKKRGATAGKRGRNSSTGQPGDWGTRSFRHRRWN